MAAAGIEARRLAWRVLLAVESGAFADAALGRALRASRLEPRDRGLAAQLVYGTLAWQGLLDQALVQLGRDPDRLDPPLRVLLRLALLQLVRLGRVPDFAAVDSAVELAKEFKSGAASGLVNALLRRFLREGKRIALPARETDLAGHLALAYSHPGWLVERWLGELGEAETEALLEANNQAAGTVLRVNRLRAEPGQVVARLAGAGVAVRPAVFAPGALYVEGAGDLDALPGYRDGWFTAQGEASQLVGHLVGAGAAARVLDACAAPGGKATLLAESLGGSGVVVALDRHGSGLLHVRQLARRLGLATLSPLRADAARPPLAPAARFDAVLVDAPCSGLGTLRQHPEIRWRRQPAGLEALAVLQSSLLAALAPHVGDGGALVYATCTITRTENEEVLDRFLATHPQFRLDDPAPLLPQPARALLDERGILRTFPHRHGLDGFFAVRLKRSAGSHTVPP